MARVLDPLTPHPDPRNGVHENPGRGDPVPDPVPPDGVRGNHAEGPSFCHAGPHRLPHPEGLPVSGTDVLPSDPTARSAALLAHRKSDHRIAAQPPP